MQPQKALVLVKSCTWTSSPITGSYLARISGERLRAVLIRKLQFINRAFIFSQPITVYSRRDHLQAPGGHKPPAATERNADSRFALWQAPGQYRRTRRTGRSSRRDPDFRP